MNINFKSSVIFVRDIDSSRHFYQDLLGQEVEMDFGLNVGFKNGLALWQVNHASQMIFKHSAGNEKTLDHQNFELYFETPDLETVSARLSDAGIQFIHPLREQPWGQRAFRVCDPDGHIVEVAEPMPAVIIRLFDQGMSVESIAERTAMPVEIIKQVTGMSDTTTELIQFTLELP